jgi:hypothetical protein
MFSKKLYVPALLLSTALLFALVPTPAAGTDFSFLDCAPSNLSPLAVANRGEELTWMSSLAEPTGPARVTILGGVRTSSRDFEVRSPDGHLAAIVAVTCLSSCQQPDHCVVQGCNPTSNGKCSECKCVRTNTQACTSKCQQCKVTADTIFIED